MKLPYFILGAFSVGLMAFGTHMASGQNYPDRPVRIVTGEVGGSTDLMSRLIAPTLTGSLGQQVIVENRGGGGVIASEIVSKASPDGYTLLVIASNLWIGSLIRKTPYDPVKDFSPISLMVRGPNILVVHPAVAANSVKELIALAKAKPGALNYSAGGTGSSNHLAAELFNSMAGIRTVRIPYKGAGPALNALMSGETQLMFPAAAAVTPHLKSGRLRALAVTSPGPSALAPGLPTMAASGLAGYESALMLGMFAPGKTPRAIINRLNQDTVRVVKREDMKEKLLNSGVESVGSSPEEFAAAIKSEMTRLSKVIKETGIKAE